MMVTTNNVNVDGSCVCDKKAELLMEILHDIKHAWYEDAYEKMDKYFPNWLSVESYDPDIHAPAISYLFNVVLLLE